MEYVKLGNSDLNVSRICLGCMGFGDASIGQHSWTIGEEPTREIIRRSLDLGVNFFDTAIAYQLGTSEQFVGRALKDMARREDVVVATKFLPWWWPRSSCLAQRRKSRTASMVGSMY